MDRRKFLQASNSAAVLALLAELPSDLVTRLEAQAKDASEPTVVPPTPQLAVADDPSKVEKAYQTTTRGIGGADVPYVYAFYDESISKFLNPLAKRADGVKPTLPKGSYTMCPTLQAFNIRQASQTSFKKKLKDQVQLRFNATASTASAGPLSWIFMNAIDTLFSGDLKAKDSSLKTFSHGNGKNGRGTALTSSPTIRVDDGKVHLQVTAFGQKSKSLWKTFFDFAASLTNSPMISAVSKGFGIPGLAIEAVNFVDGVLRSIEQRDGLVELWQTGSLEFAVTTDSSARFNMKPGLWIAIDSDYAHRSKFLDQHTLDLDYQSYRLTDHAGASVDANYLVMDIQFPSSKKP